MGCACAPNPSHQSQRCWEQVVHARSLGMGKDACLSGEHLKEGKEVKTGISFESQQQVGTQGETEAWESGLVG